jgi:UDP-N-acetylmuramyl pentapeptide phosphotransferase/UDP-N-acetylglucosamine-1-phosphate transferase
MEPVPAATLAALASFLLTGLATAYARRRELIDHPGDRHSHVLPTPRGGGAGLVAAWIGSLFLLGPPFVAGDWADCIATGVAAIALLGWWDDHRPLSARLRFLVQLAVSLSVVTWFTSVGLIAHWALAPLACVFLLWMTNLYNFMDGSNGMAGVQGVFAAGVLGWLFQQSGQAPASAVCLLLMAACAGFLPWNLGRARVFMGDVGSLALGFAFGSLLIYGYGSGAFSLPVALMVMAVFLADGTLTLLARVLKGERWYNAHRQHLYQRIIAQGWTHGRVLFLYQAINVLLVLPAIAVAVGRPALAWPMAIAMGLCLGLGWYLTIRRIGVFAKAKQE